MTVIAMTREMGSRGRDVALGLAEDLGLTLVSHLVVEHVADKMHLAEAEVDRFLEGKASLLQRWGIDKRRISAYTVDEILEVAARGNALIRGWGATYILRPVSHVLCVRVCAPLGFRTRVLMERIGIDDEERVRKEILKNDAAHTRTMQHLFHVDWQDPSLYDIVLNTERQSVPDCIDILKRILERPAFRETERSRGQLDDALKMARVRLALNEASTVHRLGKHLDVTVEGSAKGRVILKGLVANEEVKREAERAALSVPGVIDIDNQLIVPGRFTAA